MLYAYQQEGVAYLLAHTNALLAWDPGTGKTPITLTALAQLPSAPALILCPAAVKSNWEQELAIWAPNLRDVTVMSYASAVLHPPLTPRYLICDEAHLLKNPASRRHQLVVSLRRKAERCWLLTGTPVPNRPDEALALLELQGFRYGVPSYRWEQWRIGLYLESLNDFLPQTMMLRRTKAVIAGQLPPKTRERIWCDVAKIDAGLPLAVQRKLLGQAKVAEAVRLARQYLANGEKLLIFAHHQSVVEALSQQTGLPYVNGKTGKTRREDLFRQFQRDATLRGLVLNTQVGGVGLNLTAATHELIVEHDWTPAQMRQAEDRIARLGQTSPTTITYLVARHDLDINMAVTLEMKDRETESLVDGRLTPGSVYIPEPVFYASKRTS